MAKNHLRKARVGAAVVGAGALFVALAMPGAATAASAGAPSASITRAVLIQTNAGNTDIARATLVTQIQVDGEGDINFNIPVVEGAAPSNMDSFGGPTVEDGEAVYNLAVNGPQTIRTSQSFNPDDIPVDLTVDATLDGRPIDPSELKGVTGLVELTYTAQNLTSQTSTLTYKDGSGNTVTEEVELPTAMGGTLDIVFPPTWTEIVSEDATVVSGDGGGNTQVSAGYTLFEPFGEPTGTVTIEGRVTNGDMPPADIKFTVLRPEENPTARSIAGQLGAGVETGATLTDAGKQLEAGARELQSGLATATDGAQQIAAGVGGTLAPGVNELNAGVQSSLVPGVNELNAGVQTSLVPGVNQLVGELRNLPGTVTSSSDFAQITAGFATVESAVAGVRDALGVFSSVGAGQFLTASGEIDKSKTTAARTLWSLIYGVRAADVPASSVGKIPAEATGGLTNPACSLLDPTNPSNPCGAWQIVKGVSATGLGQVSAGLVTLKDAVDAQLTPGVQSLQTGLQAASANLQDDTMGSGAAWSVETLSVTVLGCSLLPQQPGDTGPIVDGTVPCANVSGGLVPQGTAAQLLNGITNGIYAPADLVTPENSGLAALLDPVFTNGTTQLLGGLTLVSNGLAAANGGVQASQGALNALLGVVTSDPNGNPDPNTANGNTATGILNELRASLALGGAGSNGVPGQCAGYAIPGNPNSGLNPNASTDQVRATCAAADVLNIAILGTQALEQGVSVTLLNGISAQLVEGVQPLVVGANELAAGTEQLAAGASDLAAGTQQLADGMPTLVDGTAQLAAGLPAAVDGAGQIVTDAALPLQESGDEAARSFGRQVALYEAMNDQSVVDPWIPGGAPTGDNITYNGVYAFELAGAGGGPSTGLNFGLAALGLAGAAGIGGLLASRARSGAAG